MKRQLAVVAADCDTVGVLCKVPHILTGAECADMQYGGGCCDGSATAIAEEYRPRFPILHTSLFMQLQKQKCNRVRTADLGGQLTLHTLN